MTELLTPPRDRRFGDAHADATQLLLRPYPASAPEVWDPGEHEELDAVDPRFDDHEDDATSTETGVVRCVSINTHRGQGPNLDYVQREADAGAAARLRLLDETRAYSFHIADWLRRHRERYHVVALQEVFHGAFRVPLPGVRARQGEFYRVFAGYPWFEAHRVGTAAFRYENVLLSRLDAPAPASGGSALSRVHNALLPGRVLRLAACGFTLAPFSVRGRDGRVRTAWIGNTHLHPRSPRSRMLQAAAIARQVRRLGDAPVLFLGDLNTVPPGCKDGDFPHGDRDVRTYQGDRTLDIFARAGLRAVRHTDDASCWTYPTGAPNRTLDYVLATRHWDIEDYRVVRSFELSDHYPVEGTFRLAR